MVLSSLTVLDERYAIRHVIDGAGSFMNTYLAWSVDDDEEVVVREYFPSKIARRGDDGISVVLQRPGAQQCFEAGKQFFLQEGEKLRALDHVGLPAEHAAFEANGTAYRVQAYCAGGRLSEALEKRGGGLSEGGAQAVIEPLLRALHAAHEQDLLHGAVSPGAVLLTTDRRTLLTDFQGASVRMAQECDHLIDLVRPGLSPIEQYTPEGRQGPWTDVYAAAATFYQLVAAAPLPSATRRLEDDPVPSLLGEGGFSKPVREALEQALRLQPRRRTQSAEQLRQMLCAPGASGASGAAVGAEQQEQPASEAAPAHVQQAKKRRVAALAGVIVCMALVGGTALFVGDGAASADPQQTYRAARTTADSLYDAADYVAAHVRYEEALALLPEDDPQRAALTARLDEVARLETALRRDQYRQGMQQGDALRAQAERLMEEGDEAGADQAYEAAHREYLIALDNRSGDSLALARAKAISPFLMDDMDAGALLGMSSGPAAVATEGAAAGALRDQLYMRYRLQGDELMDEQQYAAARRKFREALDYRPGDAYASSQLERIDSLISTAEDAEQYQQFRARADTLYERGEYELARYEYELALRAKPNDAFVAERLEAISARRAEAQQSAQQYQYYRAQGDVFFGQNSFDEAVASYERALTFEPSDAYVQQQLTRSRELLAASQEASGAAGSEAGPRLNEDGAYVVVDQSPQLIGSLAELHEKVEYPHEAARRGLEGRVTVQFVVETDGTVRDARIIRGIGGGADEEAMRVIRQARFEPALLDGEAVPAQHALWIRFQLRN